VIAHRLDTGATVLRRAHRLARRGLPGVRAAIWADFALRRLRRELARKGLEARVTRPPALAAASVETVEAVLRARGATCLERSLIVQRWLLAHGREHDIVVGVAGGTESLAAHAWVDLYDPADQGEDYHPLTRVSPSD
jgi:hypothetical protein